MVTEWITRLAPQTSRRPSVVVHSTAVAVDHDAFANVGVDGTRLPCQVLSESHERRSVTFAINVEFGGPSHRPEESLMLGRSGRWGWRRARDETRKSFVR